MPDYVVALLAAACGTTAAQIVQDYTGSVWIGTTAGLPVVVGVVYALIRYDRRKKRNDAAD